MTTPKKTTPKKKKAKKKPAKMGRPTKYNKNRCNQIIKFFSVEPYHMQIVTHRKKDGTVFSTFEAVANDLPFLSSFAHSIDVTHETLLEWTRKHPDFSLAYKRAKEGSLQFNIRNLHCQEYL